MKPHACSRCGGTGEEPAPRSESQLSRLPAGWRAEVKAHLENRPKIFASLDLMLAMNLRTLMKREANSPADVLIYLHELLKLASRELTSGERASALYNLLLGASFVIWACEKASYPFPDDVRSVIRDIKKRQDKEDEEEEEDEEDYSTGDDD